MALKLLEGLDSRILYTDGSTVYNKRFYGGGYASNSYAIEDGRTDDGFKMPNITSAYTMTKTLSGTFNNFYCGFAFKVDRIWLNATVRNKIFGVFRDLTHTESQAEFILYVCPDGSLSALFDTNTYISNPGVIKLNNSWHYIEVGFSGATVTIKVDEVEVLVVSNIHTAANGEYRSGSTAGLVTANNVRFYAGEQDSDHYYDDFYLCDTSGGNNTTFLGDISVHTISVSANAGNMGFKPHALSYNYQEVQDNTYADLTTYVYAPSGSVSQISQRDFYYLTLVPSTLTDIKGLQLTVRAQTDVGTLYDTAGLKGLIKTNGVAALSSEVTFAGGFRDIDYIFETDAESNTWTTETMRTIIAGMHLSYLEDSA